MKEVLVVWKLLVRANLGISLEKMVYTVYGSSVWVFTVNMALMSDMGSLGTTTSSQHRRLEGAPGDKRLCG